MNPEPFCLSLLPDGIHLAPAGDNEIRRCNENGKNFPHEDWMPLIRPHLKSTGTAIDVGAFIGDNSLQYVNMGYNVIAIEPFLDAFTCLCFNSPKSHNILGAAGDGSPVSLVYDCPGTNHGMRSVRSDLYGKPSIRIDSLNATDVVFIKIDCEGWETRVLEGARLTILIQRPVLFVESNVEALERAGSSPQALEELLRSFGCSLERNSPGPRFDWLCTWP